VYPCVSQPQNTCIRRAEAVANHIISECIRSKSWIAAAKLTPTWPTHQCHILACKRETKTADVVRINLGLRGVGRRTALIVFDGLPSRRLPCVSYMGVCTVYVSVCVCGEADRANKRVTARERLPHVMLLCCLASPLPHCTVLYCTQLQAHVCVEWSKKDKKRETLPPHYRMNEWH